MPVEIKERKGYYRNQLPLLFYILYKVKCNDSPKNSESLIMCSILVCGLQCKQCFSEKSWDHCESRIEVENCTSGKNRCFKGHADWKKDGSSRKAYRKRCSSTEECKTATDNKACKKGTCKVDCCSGDLCNASTVPLVSAIILSACAVLSTSLDALIILKKSSVVIV